MRARSGTIRHTSYRNLAMGRRKGRDVTDAGVTDGGTTSAPEPGGGRTSSRNVSRGALIGGVIGALVLGLIAGGLIGWQVEKKRVEDDVASVKKRVQASAARNLRPVGVITAVNGDSVTLRLASAPGSRTFRLTGSTKIDRSAGSGTGKLVKGARVIVLPDYTSGSPTASEIVVLPSSSSGGA